MVLCIVWKRAGLKLNPAIWRRTDGSAYESGTVLEFETAVEVSRKQNGVPDVFLFRKSAPVVYDADRVAEQLEQYRAPAVGLEALDRERRGLQHRRLSELRRSGRFRGASSKPACGSGSSASGVVAHGPIWDRKLKGSPFRGLAAFEASHAVGVLRPRGRDRARDRKAAAGAVPAGDRRERLGQVVAAEGRPRAAGRRRRASSPTSTSGAPSSITAERRSASGVCRGAVRRRCARRGAARPAISPIRMLLAELFAAGGHGGARADPYRARARGAGAQGRAALRRGRGRRGS